MQPMIVSIPDACAILGGVSRTYVHRLMAAGALERKKMGRRTFVTYSSLQALVESAAS